MSYYPQSVTHPDGPGDPRDQLPLCDYCPACGESLPDDWLESGPHAEPEIEYVVYEPMKLDEDGHPVGGGPRRATSEEIEAGDCLKECYGPWWDCPNCGESYSPTDLRQW